MTLITTGSSDLWSSFVLLVYKTVNGLAPSADCIFFYTPIAAIDHREFVKYTVKTKKYSHI